MPDATAGLSGTPSTCQQTLAWICWCMRMRRPGRSAKQAMCAWGVTKSCQPPQRRTPMCMAASTPPAGLIMIPTCLHGHKRCVQYRPQPRQLRCTCCHTLLLRCGGVINARQLQQQRTRRWGGASACSACLLSCWEACQAGGHGPKTCANAWCKLLEAKARCNARTLRASTRHSKDDWCLHCTALRCLALSQPC